MFSVHDLAGSGMVYFRRNIRERLTGGYKVNEFLNNGDFTITRNGEEILRVSQKGFHYNPNKVSAYLRQVAKEAYIRIPVGG